jgi:hypothetical protein
MSEKRIITEDDKVQDEWYKEAKTITEETLPAFIHKLINDYVHDYGTICHAVAAAAIAGAYAIEHSPTGGITGFQSGAVMWEFVQEWLHERGKPLALVRYENMLYPQYQYKFEKIISQETWEWLQERAKRELNNTSNNTANPSVVSHWKDIVEGKVPFGYKVRNLI